MYPRFSQTFVVNEILEHERQGIRVSILSLRKPTDGVFHESISRVAAQAHYIPETLREDVLQTLAMKWRRLRKSPSTFLQACRLIARYRGATWNDLTQAMHVLKWTKKHRIDHLHVHFGTNEATVALLVNLLGGPSYSMTLHAFDIFRDNVDRDLLTAKINASSFTITVSEYNRQYMLETLCGVDTDKIRVNYNGIDLLRFTDSGQHRSDFTLFGVGRLIEKKGFQHLIEAVDILHREGMRLRCTIAGDGPQRAKLQAMIDDAGLSHSAQLLGHQSQDQILARLQRDSCFALPCVRAADGNMDALPTVLLESLACGCPTISTRLSGIPEIIEDGDSGILVAPNDSRALANAIRQVMLDQDLATRLSVGGQKRAAQVFDIRRNVGVMRSWWMNSTRKCPPKPARDESVTSTSVAATVQ
jgi:glycosyltransferase involved in cell wall biosynthesis